MLTRRDFLKLSSAVAAGFVLLPEKGFVPVFQVPVLLDPLAHPKFVNPLPNPLDPSFIFTEAGSNHYEIGMAQTTQNVLGAGFPNTTVWGYRNMSNVAQGTTYPGRTFIVQKNQRITVQWRNKLPAGHLLPVDMSVHWADPPGGFTSGIPAVPHVHGGHTESESDGLPEHWWTFDEALKGPDFVKSLYVYDNDQEAGTIWYHDHGLGITRLNVYAGLAGFFLIRDEVDTGLPNNPLGLPAGKYEIPIAIQDRQFTADGQLYYPTMPMGMMPGFPPPPAISVAPEFFGNFILVNGVTWPFLNVEPRKYRLRLLNGSDSRFYNLRLTGGTTAPQIIQIGTDSALLNAPVPLNQLTIGTGERADVIVDFAGYQGQTLIMRNNARAPFPKGATVNPRTDGQIMAFNVGTTVSEPDKPLPVTLRPQPIPALIPNAPTRKLLLFEGVDRYGRLQPMLGIVNPTSLDDGTLLWDDPITENPALNAVEIWEVYNTTADAHPIHLHLVSFQILNRQKFSGVILPKQNVDMMDPTNVSQGGILTNVRLIGQPKAPPANELGWKDTAQMFPGEVTRIIARFDRPGLYVWHCHILSHEDHEMMRPYFVGTMPTPMAMLMLPENQALVTTAYPEFTWKRQADGLCYEIQIASDSQFANLVQSSTVVQNEKYTARRLGNGNYFWRVRMGGACDVVPGPWSERRSFTVRVQ